LSRQERNADGVLTLTDASSRDCSGLGRRNFLKAGFLGMGAMTLPELLRARSALAGTGTGSIRDKSVVLLFLGGGASHIETFNPNMDAPAPYRSVTGEVATALPGVTIGGTFPDLAKRAHRMAFVRSFRHPVADHESAIVHVLNGGASATGKKEDVGFSMGSMYAKIRGSNHPATGLPTYSLLTAPETDSQYRSEKSRVERGSAPGFLGPACAPFDPASGGTVLENMKLSLPADRLSDRRRLQRALDSMNRTIDASGKMAALDTFEQQAVDLVLRGAFSAFDLTKEDPALLARYDTSMFRIGNRKQRPQQMRDSTLGHQLLLARRLCEAGCGFVTVQSAGWDNHADGNNPNMYDGMNMLGPPLDKGVSAFLDDVEERGLSDRILLVITGDFGRTPTINKNGGRDHWSNLCTLAFAGGGLRIGQVIGKSARKNDIPASTPITTTNLMATIMHTLFDIGTLRVVRGLPANIARLVETAEPIRELVS
jgi:uncharacterized protein (DUF1501 family)